MRAKCLPQQIYNRTAHTDVCILDLEGIPESGPKEHFRKGKVIVNSNFMPNVMNYWHGQKPFNLLTFISGHKH